MVSGGQLGVFPGFAAQWTVATSPQYLGGAGVGPAAYGAGIGPVAYGAGITPEGLSAGYAPAGNAAGRLGSGGFGSGVYGSGAYGTTGGLGSGGGNARPRKIQTFKKEVPLKNFGA